PYLVTLPELLIEQREDLVGGLGTFLRAVLVVDPDLAAGRGGVPDLDTVLLELGLLAAAPELQPRENAGGLVRALAAVDHRIDVAHEIKPFRAVAVLDREPDAVEREADAPPGAVELLVERQ